MTALVVTDVRHPIGGTFLEVDRLRLDEGARLVVFGPNGSGKTTLLRVLAGTLPGGPEVACAYLPQRPHLFRGSVRHNLFLGLDREGRDRACRIAGRFGVADLLDRPAASVSGGERQRIALVRTLARPEDLVLLDEPLSAIDLRDRPRVAVELTTELEGRTSVIVTHDRDEVVALGDELLVLVDGKIRQRGHVDEVLRLPADDAVAAAIGVSNVLTGIAGGTEGPLVAVDVSGLRVWGMGEASRDRPAAVMFSAESVTVYRGEAYGGSARNCWMGTVAEVRSAGRLLEIIVDAGVELAALITPGSRDALGLEPGSVVTLAVKAASVRVLGR